MPNRLKGCRRNLKQKSNEKDDYASSWHRGHR